MRAGIVPFIALMSTAPLSVIPPNGVNLVIKIDHLPLLEKCVRRRFDRITI